MTNEYYRTFWVILEYDLVKGGKAVECLFTNTTIALQEVKEIGGNARKRLRYAVRPKPLGFISVSQYPRAWTGFRKHCRICKPTEVMRPIGPGVVAISRDSMDGNDTELMLAWAHHSRG